MLFLLTLPAAFSLRADSGPLALWYTNSALSWQQEALPVGNGKLAAMVFGGATNEQIQYNEETIWTGQPHDYSHPGGWTNLSLMRDYIFETNQTAFWNLCSSAFMSLPLRQCAYQPAGVLSLSFPSATVSNYVRSLDLTTATAGVRYDAEGTTFYRELFASAPDQVIVIRLTASRPGQVSFTCTFASPHTNRAVTASGTDLLMHVNVTQQAPSYTLPSVVQFACRLRVIAEGGTVNADGDAVSVTAADAVTLLLSVASNVVNYEDVSADPEAIVADHLAAAAAKGYAALRASQLADYQPLFQRVALDLGSTWKTNLPTSQRIKRVGEGDDPQLSTHGARPPVPVASGAATTKGPFPNAFAPYAGYLGKGSVPLSRIWTY